MLWGTQPKRAKAETWTSRKASVVSPGAGLDEAAVPAEPVQDETVGILTQSHEDCEGPAKVAMGAARAEVTRDTSS